MFYDSGHDDQSNLQQLLKILSIPESAYNGPGKVIKITRTIVTDLCYDGPS